MSEVMTRFDVVTEVLVLVTDSNIFGRFGFFFGRFMILTSIADW